MKIIGIDSSGNVASVAYVADGTLIAEYTINNKKTHSQTLLPMLDQIVRDAEIELSEIDAIAVAAGPGSFTGLRIGAATVKGLGLALEKPVIAIPTCEGLAYNLMGNSGLVVPIMDARRGQVYTGIYRVAPVDSHVILSEAKDPADTQGDSSTCGLRMT
ncbi:MAG: tRNA (adenosine(37)-N6)-threonylcarbamoyltransferase complex dimerization subunit type 1 TsaB, partial [Eubacterium sp.]|nr:tRNA (adenosine(37)-N6)-threonylcarbamoyltransferase complex dimerization subunit type 1 TsaB [Eubacterium sp.]